MTQPPPPPPGTPPPPPPGSWGGGYGNVSGRRATFGYRFLGALVDGLILGSVNALIQEATDRVTSAAIGIVIGIIYTASQIGGPSGQTLGMRVARIRVIDASTGGRVDYGRCVTRHIVAIASGLALGLGYLWMLWDPQGQTWHDKAANVYVVPVDDFPVPG